MGNKRFENSSSLVVTKKDFAAAVLRYRIHRSEGHTRDLIILMRILARNILEVAGVPKYAPEERELVYAAMERVQAYDKKKGVCFNYFTTIMLNHWRKVYRARKEAQRLKDKYDPFF